jgi:ketosteroid isomerase-like protein
VSQGTVAYARAAYEALGRAVETGNFRRFLARYVDPDVEWVPMAGTPDAVAVRRGRRAMKERLDEMFAAIAEPRIAAEDFIDADDRVVVAVRVSGRGKASGAPVDARPFHVLAERGGKVTRIEWYATRAEALKAVGLEE